MFVHIMIKFNNSLSKHRYEQLKLTMLLWKKIMVKFVCIWTDVFIRYDDLGVDSNRSGVQANARQAPEFKYIRENSFCES